MGSALVKFEQELWEKRDTTATITYNNGLFELNHYGDKTGVKFINLGEERTEFVLDELLAAVFRRDVFSDVGIPKEATGRYARLCMYRVKADFANWEYVPKELGLRD